MEESIMDTSLLQRIHTSFPGKVADPKTYSALTLAYIGDAIFDMIIRTLVVSRGNRPVNDLHRMTVRYVSAGAQAGLAEKLKPLFTEEELNVYHRGTNAKPHTTAKNASVKDYLSATGFEAVLGYLYLTDRMDRIFELLEQVIEFA